MNSLKFYRKQAGITSKELGNLLGVSEQAVSRWETGKLAISKKHYKILGEVLQVSPEVLIKDLDTSGFFCVICFDDHTKKRFFLGDKDNWTTDDTERKVFSTVEEAEHAYKNSSVKLVPASIVKQAYCPIKLLS